MAFDMRNFLNAESKKDINSDWKPVKVNVRKLRPAPDKKNFYHAEDKEIKDIAESIERSEERRVGKDVDAPV